MRRADRGLGRLALAVIIVVIIAAASLGSYLALTLRSKPPSPVPLTSSLIPLSNSSFTAAVTMAGSDPYPLDWALSTGFFKKVLPNVNVQGFPGGAGDVIHALETGTAGVGIAAEISVVPAIAQGAPIVIVAQWLNTPYTADIVVKVNSSYTNVTQLKGKVFANAKPGSLDAIALDLAASKLGWNLNNLSVIYVGSVSGQYAAVVSGKADATLFNVWNLNFYKTGLIKPLYTVYTDFPSEVIVANRDFLASHPKDVQAFIQAMIELDRVWSENLNNQSVRFLVSTYNFSLAQAEAFLRLSYATNLSAAAIYVSGIQNVIHSLQLAGIMKGSQYNLTSFYVGQFVPVQPVTVTYSYKPVLPPI